MLIESNNNKVDSAYHNDWQGAKPTQTDWVGRLTEEEEEKKNMFH